MGAVGVYFSEILVVSISQRHRKRMSKVRLNLLYICFWC